MKNFALALSLLAGMAGSVAAQTPVVDPFPVLPAAKRPAQAAPAPSGEALRKQAMDKLKARFQQADRNADAMLSKQEAEQGGFGFVSKHFDEIDTSKRGSVSFDELAAFMDQRRR